MQVTENPDLSVKWPNVGHTVLIFIFHLGQLLSCFVYRAPQKGTVYVLCKDWSSVEPFTSVTKDKDKTVWRRIQRMERTNKHSRGIALFIFHHQVKMDFFTCFWQPERHKTHCHNHTDEDEFDESQQLYLSTIQSNQCCCFVFIV